MTIDRLIKEISENHKIHISDDKFAFTGVELAGRVQRVAAELDSLGFGNRRSVILRMLNNIDSVIMFLALVQCGCLVYIANPYDPIQKACNTVKKFMPFGLSTDKPCALAIHKRHEDSSLHHLDSIAISVNIFSDNNQPVDHTDPKMATANVAIFSSGSTGEPKAILHSFERLLKNAEMHVAAVGLRESDTVGALLPLYYSYGLVANLLGALISKAHVSLRRHASFVDCAWIRRKEISFLGLTPYFSRTLKPTLPSLRAVTLGGDVLQRKTSLQLIKSLPKCQFFSTYGLTEAGPRVATWELNREVLECYPIAPLGNPLPGVKLSIESSHCMPSDSGELIVTTPTRMVGIFRGQTKGFDAVDWAPDEVRTDDLYNYKDGHMFFVGRKKNIIVQGGEKLFPSVIESAIQNIEGVIEAKVGSIPHASEGQIAKAYIVADESVSINSVRKSLKEQFTRSLMPAQFEFVNSIVRTETGKIA